MMAGSLLCRLDSGMVERLKSQRGLTPTHQPAYLLASSSFVTIDEAPRRHDAVVQTTNASVVDALARL